jgi:hypothetical protein
MRADLAEAQVEHRKPGRPEEMPYDVRRLSDSGGDGGNSAAYLLRRLARTSSRSRRSRRINGQSRCIW